ncbi:MAG: hypothetical protein HYX92_16315 [Chloroflexi bacterium]|nr:hypothetical protein [Chloroflexota bacterium]
MTIQEATNLGVLEVMDPVAPVAAKTFPPAPRLRDLSGRKIGLYSNHKTGADIGLEEIARLLESKYQDVKFEKLSGGYPHGPDVLEKVAQRGCDAIIGASAD